MRRDDFFMFDRRRKDRIIWRSSTLEGLLIETYVVNLMEENIAICRRYIMYRRVWIRYFVEKYRFGEISGEMVKNQRYFLIHRRYFPIHQRYGDKSPIFRDISNSQRGGQRATVQLQCSPAIVLLQCTLKNVFFFLLLKGLEPQTKGLGFSSSYHWGKFALVKCNALKIYIQSHHIKKI